MIHGWNILSELFVKIACSPHFFYLALELEPILYLVCANWIFPNQLKILNFLCLEDICHSVNDVRSVGYPLLGWLSLPACESQEVVNLRLSLSLDPDCQYHKPDSWDLFWKSVILCFMGVSVLEWAWLFRTTYYHLLLGLQQLSLNGSLTGLLLSRKQHNIWAHVSTIAATALTQRQ